MTMVRMLVVEKEGRTRALLQCQLGVDVKVKSVSCIESALEKLANHKFDVIIWNAAASPIAAPEINDKIVRLAQTATHAKTIVLTAKHQGDARLVRAANLCVKNHPANDEELISLVENHLPFDLGDDASHQPPAGEINLPIEFEGIIAVSLPMRAVIRRVVDAAAVDIPVLITGETGTGKDLVAAAIHRRSRRASRPYVPVNMGAMAPELIASEIFGHERGAFTGAQDARPGIFEQADGGTVFLDEIATMDEKTQVSLLRVLEEKAFRRVGGVRNIATDVRIIAATNENLEKGIEHKRFREDLFYRLNVFHISVAPLRERRAAISVLTDHFLSRFAAVYRKEIDRVSPETYRLLRKYPWPGNVRELKNVIQTAILMMEGHELTPDFIPQRVRDAVGDGHNDTHAACSFRIGATLDSVEKEVIHKTLLRFQGNKKLAAHVLGISRRALYNKLKRHRLV
jgi:DNA-binding NtrC family response regulator